MTAKPSACMGLQWEGEIGQRTLKRGQLVTFFAQRPAARVVLEACGSGHYWARTLSGLGHEVRLVHARHVRPYVRGNKNDAADAKAIWSAAHVCLKVRNGL